MDQKLNKVMFKLKKEQGDKEEVKYEENSLKHSSLAFIFSFGSCGIFSL